MGLGLEGDPSVWGCEKGAGLGVPGKSPSGRWSLNEGGKAGGPQGSEARQAVCREVEQRE